MLNINSIFVQRIEYLKSMMSGKKKNKTNKGIDQNTETLIINYVFCC